MTTNPTPQGLPLDRPRYLQETPDGWQGADHPDGPWRPFPAPQTQPPFPVVAEPHPVSLADLRDPDFSDGLTAREHIAVVRGGPHPQAAAALQAPAPTPAAAEPPLWQLMAHAYDNAPAPPRDAPDDWTDWVGYAAEILAVRDRVVPEDGPRPGISWPMQRAVWDERQAIRSALTAEAARAERGE
jgi:hypothetical protein